MNRDGLNFERYHEMCRKQERIIDIKAYTSLKENLNGRLKHLYSVYS